MIDNSLIWRGAFSVSENVATPQVIKNGDPDNRGAGMNRGAAFEAHILEIAGAKERTTETPVQNGRQLSYPQDRDNQQTTSAGQSGEPLNTSRTPGTTFALRSDEGIVEFIFNQRALRKCRTRGRWKRYVQPWFAISG